ncbi:MAG: hypothetical protein Q8K85_13255, partial [Hyphomicrobium sp.]|nr:hypothetical protein [Hyphomicrobium sp.]
DRDSQDGLTDFAQVYECRASDDKCRHQQKYPNCSGWRAVELVCGNEIGLHVLEFDGSGSALLGVTSGCKHVKGLSTFYLA